MLFASIYVRFPPGCPICYHLLAQAKALNKCDLCSTRADQYIPVHVNKGHFYMYALYMNILVTDRQCSKLYVVKLSRRPERPQEKKTHPLYVETKIIF